MYIVYMLHQCFGFTLGITIVKGYKCDGDWQGVSYVGYKQTLQFIPAPWLNFDFSQRSLLILNCVTINRNVNYDVKTERVKVKAAQQWLKIIHAS